MPILYDFPKNNVNWKLKKKKALGKFQKDASQIKSKKNNLFFIMRRSPFKK